MRYFGKALLIIMYPILIVVMIVLLVVLIQQTQENRDAYAEYEKLHEELSIPVEKKDNAKEGIKQVKEFALAIRDEYLNAQDKIETLEEQVETEQKDGYGEIRGSILPFVTEKQGLNQYQRVCAESVANRKVQYCVTVSSIQKDYVLVVPEGEYHVFATFADNPEVGKAYYTEFVECSQGAEGSNCAESLSNEKVNVSVASGGVILNIDPADWKVESNTETEEE